MCAHQVKSALRPAPDGVLSAIADYARNFTVESEPAYETARYCLMDSLACALQALAIPACRKLLGPVVPGAVMPGGARVASTAVVAGMLGASTGQIVNALSNAWIDGGALRTYRHAPNTGSRKSWAAGDATSRGVRHALMALNGEMGYPSALSAKTWGFYDVLFKGQAFSLPQPFGSYVMENVLFKISYPAEFHAQTAVEAAMALHPQVRGRLADIERILIETQEPGVRIIDKVGPLANPADRDHCIQYMVAVPLIFGRLTAADYEDAVAADARIDALRASMQVRENRVFTEEYYAPEKRYIGNAVQVFFRDGSHTERVQVDFPIGHRKRRAEGMPVLVSKFEASVEAHSGC